MKKESQSLPLSSVLIPECRWRSRTWRNCHALLKQPDEGGKSSLFWKLDRIIFWDRLPAIDCYSNEACTCEGTRIERKKEEK